MAEQQTLNAFMPVNYFGMPVLPVADPGPELSGYEGEEIKFNFSDSYDQDGIIATYSLVQVSGTPVTLTGSDTARPSFIVPNIPNDEIMQFRLSVTDTQNLTSSPVVFDFRALAINTAPIVDAGPNVEVFVGEKAQINATLEDDGEVGFEWLLMYSGVGNANLIDADTLQPYLISNYPGQVTYKILADDGKLRRSSDVTLTFKPLPDVTPPRVILEGANPYYMVIGERYREPGYHAIDNQPEYISKSRVVQTGVDLINNMVAGDYPISHVVTDDAGNTSEVATRIVKVVEVDEQAIDAVASCEYRYDGYNTVFDVWDGSNNVDVISFKVENNIGNVALTDGNKFDFDSNDITKVSVQLGNVVIDSDSSAVNWSGANLLIKFGRLRINSEMMYAAPLVKIHVGNDPHGTVLNESNVEASGFKINYRLR